MQEVAAVKKFHSILIETNQVVLFVQPFEVTGAWKIFLSYYLKSFCEDIKLFVSVERVD